MSEQNFLIKLRKKRKLKLDESSKEICESYIDKSEKCLKSARILLQNQLYENSVINSYYTMYNSLLALLFRVGIKSENHTASAILLKILFDKKDLSETISKAKEERLDKQYYIKSKEDIITKDSPVEMIKEAEEFSIKIKIIIESLNNEEIKNIRNKFMELTK